ncbi:unnamed protein product [Lathyrus sativus]|nr:unnamed protein product [Lathyrus sativus]
MDGNSQNNYTGGWNNNNNNIPSTNYSQGLIPHGSGPRAFTDNWHIPHQTPIYYADNQHIPHQTPTYYPDNRYIPQQAPTQFVDNRNLPHQAPTQFVDNGNLPHQTPTDNRHIPHPMPTHYADNRHMPHQTPTCYPDNRYIPHQAPTQFVDNRNLPHQTPTDNRHLPHPTPTYYADNRHIPHPTLTHYANNTHLPHPMPTHYADNTHLLHQRPEHYADKRDLPHPTPTHYADSMHLPSQMPAHYADKRHLPHQTVEHCTDNKHLPSQTPAHYADKRHLPHQTVEHCTDNKHLPSQTLAHYADERHLPHQTVEHCTDNKYLPSQMPAHYADQRHLPHQTVDCTDNKHMPHQSLVHYEDKMCLPHQKTKDLADKMHLPNQNPEDCAVNKCLPHKTPDHNADKTKLPQQTSEAYADKRKLPHQTSEHSSGKKLLPQQTPKDSADKKLLPQQTPKHYADKKLLPQQTPLPRTPKDSADKKLLPQQTPKGSADKKLLPQQTPKDSADKKLLPQQTPKDSADMKLLSQQTPKDSADKKLLPQQTPEDCANKKCLPPLLYCEICDLILNPKSLESHNKGKRHRRRLLELSEQATKHKTSSGEKIGHSRSSQISKEAYVDNKCLPHRMSENCAAKKNLTQQTPEVYADKKCLLQQTSKDFANKRPLPHQKPKADADNMCLPQQRAKDFANKRALPHQKPEAYGDNECLPHQMSEHYADKNNSSQQAPKDYANKKCLAPRIHCEICDIKFGPKDLKGHNNGKKHKKRLSKLREKSMKHNTSNGEEIRHIQSSQVNPVVQPKKVPADASKRKHGDHTGAKDCDFKVENVKNETSSFKKTRVPVEISKRKVMDNTDAKGHGFKHEIEGATGVKYMKMNDGTGRFVKSSKIEVNAVSNSVKSLVQTPEITPPSGHVASSEIATVLAERSSFELQSQHVSVSLSQESKGKKHYNFQNTTVEKNDQPQSTPVELNASTSSNVIAETEYVSSDFAVTATPQDPVASHVFTPAAAAGSSCEPKNHGDLLREVTEAKKHHEVQKCVEIVAEDKFSDSGAIVIALPQGLMTSQVLTPSPASRSRFEPPLQINSQIEVEEGTKLHEVQNHSVETNDQPHSISMEFHVTASSDINTLIEGSCSDSIAIVIAPPQSPIANEVPPPVAVIQTKMSDRKVHNEIQNHIVDSNNQQHSISRELHDIDGSMTNNQTEIVNSDSTANFFYREPLSSLLPGAAGSSFEPVESQHPAEESDIELPPPVLMEIDGALEDSVETRTEDGSSRVEMEMDVDLSPESGKTKLLKVSVCLTCGDEGFEEAIVYCSKCGDYAMHRYCLAGPVIFTDKVTWFCEDCEKMVVQADHHNSETLESEKDEVVFDPEPIADPIWSSGSLQVFNKSFDKISGLMAHLSTLACPKVLEEARHLPDVLYANLLQRSAMWPESFKKFGTNNLSIGLYFFPENESVERYYDKLVDEMISKDLAIRVMVEKTELLIFPSTLLPRQYKRFHSKYYLWGTFRRKHASSTMKDT